METEITTNEAHTRALENIERIGLTGPQIWVAETNVNSYYAAQRCKESQSRVDQAFAPVWRAVANSMGIFAVGGLQGANGAMNLGYYPDESDIESVTFRGHTIEPTPPRFYFRRTA